MKLNLMKIDETDRHLKLMKLNLKKLDEDQKLKLMKIDENCRMSTLTDARVQAEAQAHSSAASASWAPWSIPGGIYPTFETCGRSCR